MIPDSSQIEQALYEGILQAQVYLPADVEKKIEYARKKSSKLGQRVMEKIIENASIAAEQRLPLCQDTGLALFLIRIGTETVVDTSALNGAIHSAVKRAYEDGYLRKSMVSDPLFDRKNTQTNLPPVIHWMYCPGDMLEISYLAKGFGSENYSRTFMLRPTDGPDEVISAVVSAVTAAGPNPCPPVCLGIGIGGTMEYAGILSKLALVREHGASHADERYARLESDILSAVNSLPIGPGGLGDGPTALSCAVEWAPTHIAGLPVAVSINCWAERTFTLQYRSRS